MSTSTMSRPTGTRTGTPRVPPLVGFGVVAALWLAFGVALVLSPERLDDLWRAAGAIWLPIRAIVWVVFLPWLLGLWAWQADWSLWVRLVTVAGLAIATCAAFYPRREGR